MKSSVETLQILEAYDRILSFRAAAEPGCSHVTVARYVSLREAGGLGEPVKRPRPPIVDPFRPKIEEWVAEFGSIIRADICHRKLAALGFRGSERTTRKAVTAPKKSYKKRSLRVFRPWITEPGNWAQWDWARGPAVNGREGYLFCVWVSWSRYRVVIPTRDRKQEILIGCLSEAKGCFGGVPSYLAYRQRTHPNRRPRGALRQNTCSWSGSRTATGPASS